MADDKTNTYLDKFLGRIVRDTGATVPRRSAINFIGATVADDEANDATNVTVTGGTLAGDVTGASSANEISAIRGTTCTAGEPLVGQVIVAAAGPVWHNGAVNLANANAVTGILPTANQTPQDLVGDVSGTTDANTVTGITGPGGGGAAGIGCDIKFTGGGTPAASGTQRFFAGFTVKTRSSGGADQIIISHNGSSNRTTLGDPTNGSITAQTAGDMTFTINGTDLFSLVGGNASFFEGSAPSVAGGSNVIAIGNAVTPPPGGSNPTGGGVLWVNTGALKYRGTSGTTTTIAPAEPHCPTCGRDFALEWENHDKGEHLAVCLPCLIDALEASGHGRKFAFHSKLHKKGAT